MKEVKELNKVIAKMADQMKASRAAKVLKVPPKKKEKPRRS